MKGPTMKEVLERVHFGRDEAGNLFVKNVWGHVKGNVFGDVLGTIAGRKWQFVETKKEQAIRLIREGKGEEAIRVIGSMGN